jgi:hypothetical protein
MFTRLSSIVSVCLFTPRAADTGREPTVAYHNTLHVDPPVRKRQKRKLNLKQPTCLDKINILETHNMGLSMLLTINRDRQGLHPSA